MFSYYTDGLLCNYNLYNLCNCSSCRSRKSEYILRTYCTWGDMSKTMSLLINDWLQWIIDYN